MTGTAKAPCPVRSPVCRQGYRCRPDIVMGCCAQAPCRDSARPTHLQRAEAQHARRVQGLTLYWYSSCTAASKMGQETFSKQSPYELLLTSDHGNTNMGAKAVPPAGGLHPDALSVVIRGALRGCQQSPAHLHVMSPPHQHERNSALLCSWSPTLSPCSLFTISI